MTALTLVAFVFLEGLSSTILVARSVTGRLALPIAEQRHTQYDPLLGWVSIPRVDIPDMYGPGVFLRTNARGFRGTDEVSATVPPGRVRIVCSGDSFVLGYGVDDRHTWCHRLADLNPRIEAVNMGQGGYGVDQAYLWYMRDGRVLDHDLHVFAFITGDFDRLRHSTFAGYSKPLLHVEHGVLETTNVPVPNRGPLLPWLIRSAADLGELRSLELATRVLRRLESRRDSTSDTIDPDTWGVVVRILESLAETNRGKGSLLMLVHLPVRDDYLGLAASEAWRRRLATEAARQGLPYVDLIREYREVPPDDVREMFIPPGAQVYAGAAGHYTVRGNAWAAERLYRHILEIPALARRLAP